MIKLQFKTTGADTTDTFTVDYSAQQGENGYSQWGAQNPFNDVVSKSRLTVRERRRGAQGTGSATNVGLSPSSTTRQQPGAAVNVAPIDAARSSSAPTITKWSATGGNYPG